MKKYPRTDLGFSRALRAAKDLAAMHGYKGMRYVLYIDSRCSDKYSVCYLPIFDPKYVAEGTFATEVLANGDMVRI